MSDLDFDELDKAVNTLMSDVPKVEPPKTDDVKTLTIKTTLPDTDAPSLASTESAVVTIGTDTKVKDSATVPLPSRAATSNSLATRRAGGRFMDVVHPSSDMKTSTPNTARTASRQGVTIAPSASAVASVSAEETQGTTDVDQNTDSAPVVDVVTANETGSEAIQGPKNTSGSDWPDPLDMSGYDAEPEPDTLASSPVEVADANGDGVLTIDETEPDTTRPLDSPFLSDTKVEKRPLGGVAATLAKEDSPAEEPGHAPVLGSLAGESTDHPEAHNQLPAHPGDVETKLPPELQSDLMAIETDGDTVTPTTPDTLQTPAKDEAKVTEKSSTDKEVVKAEVATPASAAKVESTTSGPTSIAQQYREEPTTSDQSTGSIYDTDSYHQPLTHPAKHSSGWLWVIWIFLLLLVGGSGAMALYMLDII